MRTIFWDFEKQELCMIDQRRLPASLEVATLHTYIEVAEAIKNMTIRGAPAIGAAAAFGLALAARESSARDASGLLTDMQAAAAILQSTRPTAVNLTWAIERELQAIRKVLDDKNVDNLRHLALQEAQQIADEDVEKNKRMGIHGAALIDDGDTIIHHCNTGALAVVDWGTALGVIRSAHEQGKRIHVLVDETRPRLQGSRLTAWELQQYGIPF
jgi:methylthioribose-1-phosphate isomerase